MIMMSLLNQCSVLSRDRLIAPLYSVAASAISTSWITQTLLCLQHVLGTGTLRMGFFNIQCFVHRDWN